MSHTTNIEIEKRYTANLPDIDGHQSGVGFIPGAMFVIFERKLLRTPGHPVHHVEVRNAEEARALIAILEQYAADCEVKP